MYISINIIITSINNMHKVLQKSESWAWEPVYLHKYVHTSNRGRHTTDYLLEEELDCRLFPLQLDFNTVSVQSIYSL